jgi:hypothetical protein
LTFVRIGLVVRDALLEDVTMPVGDRYLGLIRRDPVPEGLDIVDLVLDGHLVESRRRKR